MTSVRTNYQSNPFVREYSWGIGVSLALHVLIALIALIVLENKRSQGMQLGHQVFTVTLEGGERLGGVFQEPVEQKGPPINPFKQSAAKEEEEEEKPAPPKKEPEKQPVKEPEEQPKEPEVKPDVEREKELEKLQADAMLEEQRRQEDEVRKTQEKKKLEEEKVKKEEQEKLKKQQDEEKKKKLEEDKKKKEVEDKKKKVEDEKLARENEVKARKDREARIKRAIGKVQQQGERPVKDVYQGESYDVGGQGFGAASLGGKGMGGGTLASLEFVSYMNRLEGHIKSGWRWIRGDEQFQAQILVRIAEDGTIQSVELVESSGNRQFDDSAVRAVYKSSPVPPPPENLYDKVREIRMVFDSHDS